jgi:hypothetical protein
MFSQLGVELDSCNHEEMHVTHDSDHGNLSHCLPPILRVDKIDLCYKECVRYTASTDGPTYRIIGKDLVFKHSSCGIKIPRPVK